MKRVLIMLVILLFCSVIAGCGETIKGIGKDASRIGRSVKQIFISD